jgi:amino acid adenylation domain-containing protein
MLQHFTELLQAVVSDASSPVTRLPLLTRSEYNQIVIDWNQTRKDYVKNETLHSLFEQQVQRSPQATAVSFEQQSLDYAELEQKATDIACLLLAKNIEPGQLVGIYLERSIELVVAVLGILKAGAAYVPLDPEYPEAHLNYIVADSNIRVMLSQKRFESRLPSEVADVVFLDSDNLYVNVEAQKLPAVTDDILAYVIYTSGSTGKPKGVMVPHAAVVNHACWMKDLFKFDQTDRMLQKSPISFDASVCEIFVPLLSGACVVLSVPGGDRDIDYLIQEIQNNKITTLILVPSALRILLQNLSDPAALGTLRRMGCGGEALTQELKQAYYESCSAPLYNLYGPTESTIDATSFLCKEEFAGDNIPIGNPVSNKQAYILDRRLQPVPIGVPGELHIGGAGLAQGYLNRAELTAEKFVADPFVDDAQARLYKTGDLARYREDGSIEYIGRIDHQVKVRGFRIELGEIETVLAQHDLIKDCAAMLFEDHQGHKNIAAYFVSDNSISTLSLRNYLRKKLPQYMIPTLLTKLDEIPVSPNGKIDYKTLTSYTEGKTIRDSVYHPPETPTEKKIVGVWETLLNVDRVGVGDNFFDIGGHSLLLIQARSAIEKEVGVSVPIADFFHQTLGQIATYCENNQAPEMSIEEV